MSTEIDSVLSGIIVLLLIIVVWKWYGGRSSCGQSSMTLSCGCKGGQCRCRGMSRISTQRLGMCPGGRLCLCGCLPGRCGCPPRCMCQQRDRAFASRGCAFHEGMDSEEISHGDAQVTGSNPQSLPGSSLTQDWQSATADIGVDQSVGDSHKDWCNSLTMNGVPTGASSCTTLEETGRSYGTANFHGLTARKWCKARQLATPAPDARVTPSQNIEEWCNISMDELI
mgnify:FL=1